MIFPANVSLEVTAREQDVGQKLRDGYRPGTRVHVTFLPDDTLDSAERTCAAVRHAGFDPVPHLTARNFIDSAALNAHLARLSAEAGVTRALVIAGDVAKPRGPFASSMDLIQTGLLRRYGIRTLLIAGHPEGHPSVDDTGLDSALHGKLSFARAEGFETEIVTQFCFEAEPILCWAKRQRGLGIDAQVRIGIAGPASIAALLRFAQRCGIGNSVRALRRGGSAVARLVQSTPDTLLHALGKRSAECAPLAGIHLYTFGGLKKTAAWLRGYEASAGNARLSAE
jgi:methylenetetrahydrofolate reductase (NADPH)